MKQLIAVLLLTALSSSCAASEKKAGCDGLTDTAMGAALGRLEDTYNLGVEFYTGRCVAKSYSNAAVMWEKAVSLGALPAKNNLAYLFSEGLGVEKNEAKAAQLWQEAAQAGHDESQVHLGTALFYGSGVPKNEALGLAWILHVIAMPPDNDELGLHAQIVEMAQQEKAKMLKAAPAVLGRAQSLAPTLRASGHER